MLQMSVSVTTFFLFCGQSWDWLAAVLHPSRSSVLCTWGSRYPPRSGQYIPASVYEYYLRLCAMNILIFCWNSYGLFSECSIQDGFLLHTNIN